MVCGLGGWGGGTLPKLPKEVREDGMQGMRLPPTGAWPNHEGAGRVVLTVTWC